MFHITKSKVQIPLLYLTTFLVDLCNSFLIALCIYYSINILNINSALNGWIGAAYGITYLFASIFIGRLSDRYSRKAFLSIALILQSCTSLLLFILPDLPMNFLILLLFLGLCNGFFWPTMEAALSEINETQKQEKNKNQLYNFCVAWALGYGLGPWVADFYANENINIGFLLIGILTFIGFILLQVILINTKQKKQPILEKCEAIRVDRNDNKRDSRVKNLILLFILICFISSTINKIFLVYIPDFMNQSLLHQSLDVSFYLLLFGIGRLIYFICGRMWKSNPKFIIISLTFFSIMFLSLIWINNNVILSLIFVLSGFLLGLQYIISLNTVLDLEKHTKGKIAGYFEGAIGLGGGLSPILIGLIAEINIIYPLLIVSMFLFFVNMLYSTVIRKIKK